MAFLRGGLSIRSLVALALLALFPAMWASEMAVWKRKSTNDEEITRTSLLSNVELSLEGLEAGRRKNGD